MGKKLGVFLVCMLLVTLLLAQGSSAAATVLQLKF